MPPKVSVVIPVYNVEKFLHRCVDSVLNQTYNNLECILVDDGSSDKSPSICDEYAHLDNRVVAIHKENGGQSSARNAALDYPLSGEYITFVDSDDWIEPDTIQYCLNLIDNYNVDIVQFQMIETNTSNCQIRNKKEQLDVLSGKEILQKYLFWGESTGNYGVWGGLYRKGLFDGIRFREGKINEDIDFKYKLLSNAQSMIFSNQIKYFYYQSGNTTSMGGLKLKDFDLYDAAEELFKLTKDEEYGKIKFLGEVKKARTAFSLLCKIAYYGISDPALNKEETVRHLTIEHRKNTKLLLKSPMPISRKVLVILFFINYNISEKTIKTLKHFLIY